MTTAEATLEQFGEQPDREMETLQRRLNKLRQKEGLKPVEFPDLRLEKQELAEKNESLLQKSWEAIKGAFDFLVVKPAKWLGNQIKEHPFRTALIALAAFALWYYSAPLSAGLSGIKEKGIAITSDLLGKSLGVDATQINAFSRIVNPTSIPGVPNVT